MPGFVGDSVGIAPGVRKDKAELPGIGLQPSVRRRPPELLGQRRLARQPNIYGASRMVLAVPRRRHRLKDAFDCLSRRELVPDDLLLAPDAPEPRDCEQRDAFKRSG